MESTSRNSKRAKVEASGARRGEKKPAAPDRPADAGGGERQVGFWKRVFGGTDSDASSDEAESAPAARKSAQLARTRAIAPKNRPRKREQTIFDKAEEEQRRRHTRAAMIRRERLAGAISERVEDLLNDHLQVGDEKLAHAAASFQEMNGLLGHIGRNLDVEGERSARMVESIERLPQLAEQEQVVLRAIARSVEGQARTAEHLPEVMSLVREGSQLAQARLQAIEALQGELALQRDQRGQMMELMRQNALRFDERLSGLETSIQQATSQARADASVLRTSIEQAVGRLVDEQREGNLREEHRGDQVRQGLNALASRLDEQNVLTTAGVAQQGRSLDLFQDAHEEMIDLLQRHQTRTLTEMHRLQEESREREQEHARRSRMALVGSAGLLAIVGSLLFGWNRPQPQPTAVMIPPGWAPATAPASPAREVEQAAQEPAQESAQEFGVPAADVAPTTTRSTPQVAMSETTLPAGMKKAAPSE